MGASFAKLSTNLPPSSSSTSSSLEDIPENCISIVLMYLDPPEICNLASLSHAFRSTSSADFVWESKLPSNYIFLLHRVLQLPLLTHPKKEIFARLTRPCPFDHATKEFWLDKKSGKNFISISSKALKITGIDDRRYWNYIPTDESR